MNDIYVTGHRNPDTDAIVAAMAYANLRNALGDREYKAIRIGPINDETRSMLDHFGFEPPMFVKTMRTQISDIEFDTPPELNCGVSMDLAWRIMREGQIATIPIVRDDGTLHGMLSAGDIASYDMQTIYDAHIEALPVFNLLSVLEGQLVNEFGSNVETITGDVVLALPQTYGNPQLTEPSSIVICGDQPEIIDAALKAGVCCLIICQADVDAHLTDYDGGTCIISTPLDARRVGRLIFQAMPVEHVSKTGDIICFHLTDYLDDVRELMLKSRYRCYPVLDENDHVVGTLSRFHLLRPKRKRVVLVDHNEAAQSVHGLDQVEILEIIDHHRLADIQTGQPISVRNEPVGSTNTIITSMYQEHGVTPSPKMAGLMAAAILSDTVMFKSPTCTKKDIAMAERLARIARISLKDLGRELFSSTSDGKSAEELLGTDYKEFHISGQTIGVGQITCVDSSKLVERRDEFIVAMEKVKQNSNCDLVILMITDVLLDGSHIFYVGSDDVMQEAFSTVPKDKHMFLPKVMSRKKQIIPMLTAMWG